MIIERDVVRAIVNRIYGQTSVRLDDEQLESIVDAILSDERWIGLTEKIANLIYEA